MLKLQKSIKLFKMTLLSIEHLQNLIEINSADVKIVGSNLKSAAWSNFYQIFYKNTCQNFAQCKKCKKLIKRDGTSGMNRHVCKDKPQENQMQMTSFIKRKLPPAEKERLGKIKNTNGFPHLINALLFFYVKLKFK